MSQCILLKKGGGGVEVSNDFPPQNVTKFTVTPKDRTLVISWLDPKDTIAYGTTLSKWKGTKVIYNEERFPLNPDDGILIVDNRNRNYYNLNPKEVPNLINGKTYYIAAFPYSDKDAYCLSTKNYTTGIPTGKK